MSSYAPIWSNSGALVVALVVGARDKARIAATELRASPGGREAANAKAALEEAAAVGAASLTSGYRLTTVEAALDDDAGLPELLPLTRGQIKLLVGSDSLASAFARTEVAHLAELRLLYTRHAHEREEAYAEGREDELALRRSTALDLLEDARAELRRAVDTSVLAEVVSLHPLAKDDRAQRGILGLIAA